MKKLIILSSLFFASLTSAQTFELEPIKDNTLYETVNGNLSNGQGNSLFIGRTGNSAGNALRRAVLAFNLNGIPNTADISSASLSFEITMQPPIAAGFDANLHRLNQDWGEGASEAVGAGGSGAASQTGDATWVHTFFNGQFWQTPGGDFEPTPSSSVFVDGLGRFTFPLTSQLLSDLNDWRANPRNNFGWIILGSEFASGNARRIASGENPQVQLRPRLTITLSQPRAVGIPTLSIGGFLVLSFLVLFFVVYLQGKKHLSD